MMVDRMVYVLASLPCKASYTPSKSSCQLSDILQFSQFDCSGAASDNFCDADPSGAAVQTTFTTAWFCGGYLLPNQVCILVLFCKADLFWIQAILTGLSATAVSRNCNLCVQDNYWTKRDPLSRTADEKVSYYRYIGFSLYSVHASM